jgi:hypothetical protein
VKEEGKKKEKEEKDKHANRDRQKKNTGMRNEENKGILKYP